MTTYKWLVYNVTGAQRVTDYVVVVVVVVYITGQSE